MSCGRAERLPGPGVQVAVLQGQRFALLLPLIAACGGASGHTQVTWVDPESVSFDYGAAADAASSQAVVGTAHLIQAAAAETTDHGDVSLEYSRALEILWSARNVAEEAFYGVHAPGPEVFPSSFSGCFVVHDTELLWDGCQLTETEPEPGDSTVTTYSGRMARTSSSLSWDVTKAFEETATNLDGHARNHWTGNLVITPGRIAGSVRCDMSTSVAEPDGSFSSALATTYDVDLDLVLDADRCPTGGTLEVKELWAMRDGRSDLPDRGALFTWSACGQVTASIATR